ncbi:MAG TPA: hypothetical protein VMJ14_06825 [Burkholderiales bacterium]|nr:hypothetical protein [Burkholderiales bacterium]
MDTSAAETSAAQRGWRFGLGVGLIGGGYVFLLLIPAVTSSDLSLGMKSTLTGFFAISPLLTKLAAIAVMGKPGFNLVKRYVSMLAGRMWPDHVSRVRHRIGLSLFVTAVIFDLMLPYFPGYFVDWKAHGMFWSIVGDIGIISGIFVLGGEFWFKVMDLFRYEGENADSPDDQTPDRTGQAGGESGIRTHGT